MKKILIAAMAIGASASTNAFAADGNAAAWDGPYMGVALGAGIDKHQWTTTAVPDPLNQVPTDGDAPGDYANPANLNKTGVRGEAYVGYNAAIAPNVVAGIEVNAGYNFSGGKSIYGLPGTVVGDYPAGLPDLTAGKTTWDGSVRARLGYAASPSTLLFGTVGVAFGNVKYQVNCTDSIGWCDADQNETQSQIRAGLTLGAGVEHKLSSNLSTRLEYRYANLGTKSSTWLGGVGTDIFMADTSLKSHAIMLGVSYHFGQ